MQTQVKNVGLTGNQLKLIALIAMTADHIGYMLLPHVAILRYVGRLALPIFAWMIAEGCQYTKNSTRYFFTIYGLGMLCQIVYLIFMQSLYQCILITFSLSILLIFAIREAIEKKTVFSVAMLCMALIGVWYACVLLPNHLPNTDFAIDYGIWGVLLPVAIYIAKEKWQKLLAAAVVLSCIAVGSGTKQWFSLFALPLLMLYNTQRGKWKLKYLFYIYYPLHLVAIYGINLLLK